MIPCQKVELLGDGDDQQCVITEPFSVIEIPLGDGKAPRIDLQVMATLTGGVGVWKVRAEVRRRLDESREKLDFWPVGKSDWFDIPFTLENRGIESIGLMLELRSLPIEHPGIYELRLVALADGSHAPLDGARAEIRILSQNW